MWEENLGSQAGVHLIENHVLLIGGLLNFVIDIKLSLSKCESEAIEDWICGLLGQCYDGIYYQEHVRHMKNRHQFLFYNKLLPY